MTARAGSATDFPNGEYPEIFDRPVTESVTAQTGSDTDSLPVGNIQKYLADRSRSW